MSLPRYKAQLDSILRRPYVKPERPLSGIEKELLEQSQTAAMWKELEGKQ